MKRISTLMLTMYLALTLTACGGTKQSGSGENAQSTQQNVSQTQEIPSSSEATKSGSTKEFEYKIYGDHAVITKYIGPKDAAKITVPSEFEGYPVVRIGDYKYGDVFANLNELEYIELPDTLKELGGGTFANCKKLKKVELPEGLTIIGSMCFSQSGIETITIPSKVKTLEKLMFQFCSDLEEVYLSEGLETIESWAFNRCEKLIQIEFPSSLKAIKEQAFNSTGLVSAYIPAGVEEMGANVFNGCKDLVNVYMENKLTQIPEGTFYNCESLCYIYGIENAEEIGKNAFSGCKAITSIDLPEGLKTIDEAAFEYCTGLTDIDLPHSVEYVGERAFHGCENLYSVLLSNSIKVIGNLAFYTPSGLGYKETNLLVYNLNMPMPEMKNAFPNGVCFVTAGDSETMEQYESELKTKNPGLEYSIENFYNDDIDVYQSNNIGAQTFIDVLLAYAQNRIVAFADLKDLDADNVPELIAISIPKEEDSWYQHAAVDIYKQSGNSVVKCTNIEVEASQETSMYYVSKNGQSYIYACASFLRQGVVGDTCDYIGVDGFHENTNCYGDYNISEELEYTHTLNGTTSQITEAQFINLQKSYQSEGDYILSCGGLSWYNEETNHSSYDALLKQLNQ